MKQNVIAGLIVSTLVLGLLIGCAPQPKAPEDIIPLLVTDFKLVEKKERIQGNEGEVYSASSRFIPIEGSKYQGKVAEVDISVHLGKNETTAISIFQKWAQTATHIQVNGVDTLLAYVGMSNWGSHRICAIQQRGRLIIYSNSFSPTNLDAIFIDAPTPEFDKQALTDAAIQCIRAIRL